jgi:hypothetical protein
MTNVVVAIVINSVIVFGWIVGVLAIVTKHASNHLEIPLAPQSI